MPFDNRIRRTQSAQTNVSSSNRYPALKRNPSEGDEPKSRVKATIINARAQQEPRKQSARELSPELEAKLAKQADLIKRLQEDKECLGITQPGYATGDQFSIAATLASNPKTVIFIEKVTPEVTERDQSKKNKVAEIVEFYTSCGIDPGRIALVDKRSDLKSHSSQIMSESKVTDYVAKNYDDAMRKTVRKAFRVGENHDKVEDWLLKRGITIQKSTPVVVLWSRFSGKGGAAHPEHDTSYEGMRQIIRKTPGDCTVIIAGDRYPREGEANDKYNEMVKEAMDGKLGDPKRVIDLTNIWKEEGVDSWANDRVGQLRIYDYLNEQSAGNLIHIGSRSGNLEAMALIGHDAHYLEEENALGASRMTSWAKNKEGLRYLRTLIDKPATISGQITKARIDEDRKQKYVDKIRKEKFPGLDHKIELAKKKLETLVTEAGINPKEFKPTDEDLEQWKKFKRYQSIDQQERDIKKMETKDPEGFKEKNEKLSKLKEERDHSPEYKKFQVYKELEKDIRKEQGIAAEMAENKEKTIEEKWSVKKLEGKQTQLEKCQSRIEEHIKNLNGDSPGKGITKDTYKNAGDFKEYQKYKVVEAYQEVEGLNKDAETLEKLQSDETIQQLIDLKLITAQEVENTIVDPNLLSPAFLKLPQDERRLAKQQAEGERRLKLIKGFTENDLEKFSSLYTENAGFERVIVRFSHWKKLANQ